MKAQRVIPHRDHSELAVCEKYVSLMMTDVGPRMLTCGQPMQLHITKSPMRGYDFLVILRCPDHITSAWGGLE